MDKSGSKQENQNRDRLGEVHEPCFLKSDPVECSRKCSRCKTQKARSDFHRKRGRWDSRCKPCVKVIKALNYRKKKKKVEVKGVRQIEFDRLETDVCEYSGSHSPDATEIQCILQAFVLEDVYEIK